MVAYSYKRRFVDPIRCGLGLPFDEIGALIRPKLHTIRSDRKRHARPGEELQHYCGMRTKGCFLIGRARCTSVDEIRIYINAGRVIIDPHTADVVSYVKPKDLDQFAVSDGFDDWSDMREFWRSEHDEVTDLFIGVIIKWKPLS